MPRWVDARRVTFKYGLGDEFIGVLKTLHKLGLDRTDPVRVGGGAGLAARRGRRLPARPGRPRRQDDRPDLRGHLGDRAPARTARPREVYLYHVVDNAWSMAEYGSQAVVWQTAVNPVVALELIDSGAWSGAGVLGPEALPAGPFLDLLTDYGSPWAMRGARTGQPAKTPVNSERRTSWCRNCGTSSAASGRTPSYDQRSELINPSTGEVFATAPVSGADRGGRRRAPRPPPPSRAGATPPRGAQPGPAADRRRDRGPRRRVRDGRVGEHRQADRADHVARRSRRWSTRSGSSPARPGCSRAGRPASTCPGSPR